MLIECVMNLKFRVTECLSWWHFEIEIKGLFSYDDFVKFVLCLFVRKAIQNDIEEKDLHQILKVNLL